MNGDCCRINKLKAVPLLWISKDYRSIRESNHYIQCCAPISGGETRGFVPPTSVDSAAPPTTPPRSTPLTAPPDPPPNYTLLQNRHHPAYLSWNNGLTLNNDYSRLMIIMLSSPFHSDNRCTTSLRNSCR